MAKFVILKIAQGTFQVGFQFTLQIGVDGKLPYVESQGFLPPAPELPQHYQTWRSVYRRLEQMRITLPPGQITQVSTWMECEQAAMVFRQALQQWFQEFPRDLREPILEEVKKDDAARLMIQTQDVQLKQLPWHLWDLVEQRRPNLEITLATDFSKPRAKLKAPVRILGILGGSDQIDIQKDRNLLECLTPAKVTLLEQPKRQELNEQLWQKPWDILFFAGHSVSTEDQKQGFIQINQTESLSLEELRFALKNAISHGLKLAIFNSCDGLGLATNLGDMGIPRLIVMREPVPDPVAQSFLRYFLDAFSQGESLHQAVRKAREQLQGLEGECPCATWLPVICENPNEPLLLWPKPPVRRIKNVGLAIGAVVLAGLLGWAVYSKIFGSSPVPPPSNPTSGSSVSLPKQQWFSLGEKILITAGARPEKAEATKYFADKDYADSIQKFQASLSATPNDPESLIYLNNARAFQKGHFYRIAVSVPIGGNLNNAEEILRGVAQFQDEINNGKGINGSPLQVLIVNDNNDPELAKTIIAPALVADSTVLAVIGHNASETSIAAAPIYQKNGLVMISPTSGASELSGMGSYIFRTATTVRTDAMKLGEYALKVNKTKFAICIDSASPYSTSFKAEFKSFMLEAGGQISSIDCDLSNPNFNINNFVTQVLSDRSDALLLIPSVERIEQGSALTKALKGRLALFGGSTNYSIKTLQYGFDVNNMVISVVWHESNPAAKSFVTEAAKRWRGGVNWRTAMTYDAAQVIATGLQLSKTRHGLQQVLRDPNFQLQGVSGLIQFLPSGDRKRHASLGTLVQVRPDPKAGEGYTFVVIEP